MSKQRKRSQEKGQPVWDALNGVSAAVGNCNSILMPLTPYLQNQELLDQISDKPRFYRLVQTLDRDVRSMTDRFAAIQRQHAGRRGHTEHPDDVLLAIEIQEQYVEWASQFDDVIVPVFMELVEILRAVGAGNINVPSATAAVQQAN